MNRLLSTKGRWIDFRLRFKFLKRVWSKLKILRELKKIKKEIKRMMSNFRMKCKIFKIRIDSIKVKYKVLRNKLGS